MRLLQSGRIASWAQYPIKGFDLARHVRPHLAPGREDVGIVSEIGLIRLQEGTKFAGIFSDQYIARVAQLVEPHVANVAVAGSNPVSRSRTPVSGGFSKIIALI